MHAGAATIFGVVIFFKHGIQPRACQHVARVNKPIEIFGRRLNLCLKSDSLTEGFKHNKNGIIENRKDLNL